MLKPNSKINLKFIQADEQSEEASDNLIKAILTIDDNPFIGAGVNKNVAKTIAYKKAVRACDSSKKIIFF